MLWLGKEAHACNPSTLGGQGQDLSPGIQDQLGKTSSVPSPQQQKKIASSSPCL